MWILAIETTSAQPSLAVLADEALRAERMLPPGQAATHLFGALQAVLDAAGIGLPDLDAIAVSDGPGSFTGVRIGLSATKGLIEVLRIPAAPLSTLRAVAAAGLPGEAPVLAALDASRHEIYYGWYAAGPNGAAEEEGLTDAAGFESRLQRAGRAAFTPHEGLRERWPQLQPVAPGLAAAVGRVGRRRLAQGFAADGLRLDARYIRRSDAEIFSPPAP